MHSRIQLVQQLFGVFLRQQASLSMCKHNITTGHGLEGHAQKGQLSSAAVPKDVQKAYRNTEEEILHEYGAVQLEVQF